MLFRSEELIDIADFQTELGINFIPVDKAKAEDIEVNNTLVWARKVFKTKPNRDIPEEVREEVKKIFHHLTKEELMDKVLANYFAEISQKAEKPVKDKKSKKKR